MAGSGGARIPGQTRCAGPARRRLQPLRGGHSPTVLWAPLIPDRRFGVPRVRQRSLSCGVADGASSPGRPPAPTGGWSQPRGFLSRMPFSPDPPKAPVGPLRVASREKGAGRGPALWSRPGGGQRRRDLGPRGACAWGAESLDLGGLACEMSPSASWQTDTGSQGPPPGRPPPTLMAAVCPPLPGASCPPGWGQVGEWVWPTGS